MSRLPTSGTMILAGIDSAGETVALRINADGTIPNADMALNDLTDVDVTSPADGHYLAYDAVSGKWTDSAGLPGSGTVTSVGVTVPSILTVGGSPVTTVGVIALALATQAMNTVLAGPTSGADATPTFRLLVAADIPNLAASKITSGVMATAQLGTGGGAAGANFLRDDGVWSNVISGLGIGTTPSFNLDILGQSGIRIAAPTGFVAAITFAANGGSATGFIGTAVANSYISGANIGDIFYRAESKRHIWSVNGGSSIALGINTSGELAFGSSMDAIITRDAADILAFRRTTNPQEARWYGTYTDASNYERFVIRLVSGGTTIIGNEKAGTGTARALAFQTNGTTALTISTAQVSTFAGAIIQSGGTNQFSSPVRAQGIAGNQIQLGTGGLGGIYSTVLNTIQFGQGPSATPGAGTIIIGDSSRGTTDTNVAGANGIIQSGLGTGNATGSSLIFQTPTAGSTGTTAQSYATRLTISQGSTVLNQGLFTITDGTLRLGNSSGDITLNGANLYIPSATTFGWNLDVFLARDAANVLAQRNSTNAQEFRLYHSYTDASNYDRVALNYSSSEFQLVSQKAGTGANLHIGILPNGNLDIGAGGSYRWSVTSTNFQAAANYNIWNGTSALATNATAGFLGVNSCAGTPTGAPASIPTGQVPLVYDTTNHKLYAYDGGAWKSVTLA